VKRWLREAIRRHPVAHDTSLGGIDVVFIARPTSATAGYDALSGQVNDAFATLIPRSA
jgi:ribonuclease P protein component